MDPKYENYVIAIPSYKRHHILVERTLMYLFKANIDKLKIHIFVANQEEYNNYVRVVPTVCYHKIIIIGGAGIGRAREFMANYFDEGQRIMYIDDDLSDIEEKVNDKTVKSLENLKELINFTFRHLDNHKLGLCGVYPVRNALFQKKTLSTDLKFCIGQLAFTINDKSCETRDFNLLEDFERTLKYYIKYGGVLRYNYLFPKADYNRLGGGCQDLYDRSVDSKRLEIDRFISIYPQYCRIKEKKNTIDLNFIKKKNYDII